jgi:hypothetical protein
MEEQEQVPQEGGEEEPSEGGEEGEESEAPSEGE